MKTYSFLKITGKQLFLQRTKETPIAHGIFSLMAV